MTRSAPLLAGALLLLAAGTAPAAGQGRSLEIARFHADLAVEADGTVRVMESITVDFTGSWNGIFRTIPVEYRDDRGLRYRLMPRIRSITGESGEELWYEASRDGIYRKLKIAVPGASNVTRTVHIRYDVPNALKFFEEHDELYWNVTGTEWPFPIRSASATVALPDGVEDPRATAFVGGFGSTERGALEETEDGFYLESPRPLGIREGLTAAVAWAPGVVARPGPLRRAWWFIRANWLFAFPFLTFFLMHRIWRARGKDPARRSIVPRYGPPEGMTPAEVGTLVDNRPDMRDVTASVVDLAVRGYLRIEEVETEKLLGLVKSTDYRFVRTRDADAWQELHAHERRLLRALFSGSHDGQVMMSDLEHEFYRDLPDIKKGLWDRLLDLGLYDRRPDRVLTAWMVGGAVFAFVAFMSFMVVSRILFLSPSWTLLAAFLTVLPVFGFGVLMPARTVRGARKLEEVLGLQEFLERVEKDRFKRMITGPEMFEKLLPHAMALGVDRKWAAAFDDIYREPPDWYVGAHPAHFRTSLFVASMNDWSSRAGTAMASQPRSTGGSGFGGGGGGGGFSGGGFGGGGGGGW